MKVNLPLKHRTYVETFRKGVTEASACGGDSKLKVTASIDWEN